MKFFIRIFIFIWIIIANIYLFYSGYRILNNSLKQKTIEVEKPKIPNVPPLDKDIAQYQVNIYQEQIKAYEKEYDLYSTRINNIEKSTELETYKGVINDSIISIFEKILIALISFVFVNTFAQLLNNYLLIKNNKSPNKIEPWGFY